MRYAVANDLNPVKRDEQILTNARRLRDFARRLDFFSILSLAIL